MFVCVFSVRFDFKVDMSLNQSDDRQSQPDASASIDDYHSEPDGKGIRDDSQTGSFDQVKPARMTFKEFEAKEYNMKHKHTAGDDTINKYDDMDCFICVILSYGEPGVVYCPGANNTDRDDLVELKKLMEPLKGNRCRGLLMKPKLFFIQYVHKELSILYVHSVCLFPLSNFIFLSIIRVVLYEYYDEADYGKTETKKEIIKKVPVEADFLIQSCHLDASFGTLGKGQKTSWFIRALCEALQTFCIDEMKNSQEKRSLHFLTVLTRVNRLVARFMHEDCSMTPDKKFQIPLVTSLLTKHMYFYAKNK
ncbi:hypothetical protein KUTeg_004732 [Tegillarca granosa]|uniref:Uncharacterized protein n=1 Tax=Tegillarca granosa TaxID=220873 RepID=A0ABQ9FM92_TEGGR|nr:hypothetical protein KUTeg_004732 [Tegillarca granosa]